MASRGRLSPGACASNNPSTRSAQSAAQTATIRRSASLSVCGERTPGFSHAFRRSGPPYRGLSKSPSGLRRLVETADSGGDIDPDPMSQALADGWRAGVAKELERQNAAMVQA